MVNIAPAVQLPLAVDDGKGVNAGVVERKAARTGQGQVKGVAEKAFQDTAVRDDEKPLAGMTCGKVIGAGDGAFVALADAFAAGDYMIRIIAAEQSAFLRVLLLELFCRQALDNAEVSFTQADVGCNLQADLFGNNLSGLQRPAEIAAIQHIDPLAEKRVSNGLGLGNAQLSQFGIQMPLVLAGSVPDGLAVADDN